MDVIILAAGYGTRFEDDYEKLSAAVKAIYDLKVKHDEKFKPKGLFIVNDKPVIDYLIEKINKIDKVDRIYIITNNKFYKQFVNWSKDHKGVKILNDGTKTNEKRLGAIRDLELVIAEENINEDILILGSDLLFDFEITDLVNFFDEKGTNAITVYERPEDELSLGATVKVDENWKITAFKEKSKTPLSKLYCPAIYLLKKETLPLVKEYLSGDNNPDAPGYFMEWLFKREDGHAFKFEERFDTGTVDTYIEVDKLFKERKLKKS